MPLLFVSHTVCGVQKEQLEGLSESSFDWTSAGMSGGRKETGVLRRQQLVRLENEERGRSWPPGGCLGQESGWLAARAS